MNAEHKDLVLRLYEQGLDTLDIVEHTGLDYSDVEAALAETLESPDEPEDNFRDDVEADADVLRMAGMGTDEDYGFFGGYGDE
tara:strand:+ start:1359 stop:1607 length:249 start_codon:yes stop_codon:yes gene_type:complete